MIPKQIENLSTLIERVVINWKGDLDINQTEPEHQEDLVIYMIEKFRPGFGEISFQLYQVAAYLYLLSYVLYNFTKYS